MENPEDSPPTLDNIPISSPNADNQITPQPQITPPSKFHLIVQKFRSKKVIITTVVIIGTLITSGLIYTLLRNRKTNKYPVSESSQQEIQSKNIKFLENKYWGFKVDYPKQWISWDSETGTRYYIESYDGQDIDTWYVPRQDQIRVVISILPKDMGEDFTWAVPDRIVENTQGPVIGGVSSKKVVWKGDFTGYEKSSHESRNYPQSHIDRGHYVVQYILLNNNFTYIVSAEPADSTLIGEFNNIISSFEFIQRSPVYKEYQGEIPENVKLYQNTRVGFAFEYPSNLNLQVDEDRGGFEDGTGHFSLAYSSDQEYSEFEKDITRYVSLICAAGGPGGSIYCPEEDIEVTKFQNNNGVEGYRLRRKTVWESYSEGKTSTSVTYDTIIAYQIFSPDYFAIIYDTYQEEEQPMTDIANTLRYLEAEE